MDPPRDPPRHLHSWLLWARWSPYSPQNLGHLPQPKPKDAPTHIQPGILTFQDAFEDLLTVSSGQPLPDILPKYEMRKLWWHVHGGREDVPFWIARLHSRGLLDNSNFEPSRSPSKWDDRWYSRHTVRGRFGCHPGQDEDHDAWPQAVAPWGERGAQGRTLFEELDDITQRVDKRLPRTEHDTEATARQCSIDTQTDKRLGKNATKESSSGPDTFDDLFSTVQSAVSHGASSLSTLVKIARDSWEEAQAMAREVRVNQETTTAGSTLERVESSEEYTDAFGNKHVKRTVKTLNQDGTEIGREVYIRIQRENETLPVASGRAGASSSGGGLCKGNEEVKKQTSHERSGWFWK
jgi:hypothetical protein